MKIEVFDTMVKEEMEALRNLLKNISSSSIVSITSGGTAYGDEMHGATFHWVTVVYNDLETR